MKKCDFIFKNIDPKQVPTSQMCVNPNGLKGSDITFDRDCPDTCEIVKLNKRVDEQQADIDTLIIMDKASRLEIETLKEGEDCPDCDNNSGYLHLGSVNREVPPEPCEWCHDNPLSKFNRARWKK
jgi:hypothetical protein